MKKKIKRLYGSEIKNIFDVFIYGDLENYSPIRVSLGKYTTKEEMDKFIETLKEILKR